MAIHNGHSRISWGMWGYLCISKKPLRNLVIGMTVQVANKTDTTGYMVGGLEHFSIFHSVGNVIIPTDEVIFFRGVG